MEDPGDDRRTEDPQKERGFDAAREEPERDHKADHEREDRAGVELTERDEAAALDHDAGVHEPDQQDEQTDAYADRAFERERDRVEDHLAEPGEDEDRDDHALHEDDPHRGLPRQLAAEDELERDDRVQAEAGGEGERPIGPETHRDGEEACGQRGHRDGRLEAGTEIGLLEVGDRVEVQDLRVEKDDVGHHEEGREAADDLSADGGRVLAKLELALEDARRFHPPGRGACCHSLPPSRSRRRRPPPSCWKRADDRSGF